MASHWEPRDKRQVGVPAGGSGLSASVARDPAAAHLGLVVHPLWAAVRLSKGRGSWACVTFPDPDLCEVLSPSRPPHPILAGVDSEGGPGRERVGGYKPNVWCKQGGRERGPFPHPGNMSLRRGRRETEEEDGEDNG